MGVYEDQKQLKATQDSAWTSAMVGQYLASRDSGVLLAAAATPGMPAAALAAACRMAAGPLVDPRTTAHVLVLARMTDSSGRVLDELDDDLRGLFARMYQNSELAAELEKLRAGLRSPTSKDAQWHELVTLVEWMAQSMGQDALDAALAMVPEARSAGRVRVGPGASRV